MTQLRLLSTWDRWRIRQRKRRMWVSWGTSLGLTALVLAGLLWGALPALLTVGEKGQALAVKLGNPEGEDLPLSVTALPDPSMQAVLSAQRDSARNTVEETRASTDTGPLPAPLPKKAASTPADATKAVSSANPTPATSAPQQTKPSDKPVVTEKVIRGSEKGNSSELVLKPQGEKISQNAYWPVYLFMPLPSRLDSGLLAKVPASKQRKDDGSPLNGADERKALLLQFYSKTPDGLVLSSEPGLPDRPALWQILEDAGYDVENADYKRGKDLTPVVITFQLGIPQNVSDNPVVSNVHLDQSSGSGSVDDAVLYAFQKSTFANGTGQVAQGRYTYDFTAKK